MPAMPPQFQRFYERPAPDALTRGEVARQLEQPYQRVYYWTAAPSERRAHAVIEPTYGHPTRKGEPAWFSPEDVEILRRFLSALDHVQAMTHDHRASRVRRSGEHA